MEFFVPNPRAFIVFLFLSLRQEVMQQKGYFAAEMSRNELTALEREGKKERKLKLVPIEVLHTTRFQLLIFYLWITIHQVLGSCFNQGEVLFLQVAYNCLHAAKIYFMKLLLEQFLDICTKDSKKCQLRRILNQIFKHQ